MTQSYGYAREEMHKLKKIKGIEDGEKWLRLLEKRPHSPVATTNTSRIGRF